MARLRTHNRRARKAELRRIKREYGAPSGEAFIICAAEMFERLGIILQASARVKPYDGGVFYILGREARPFSIPEPVIFDAPWPIIFDAHLLIGEDDGET